MFDTLSDRLGSALDGVRSSGNLTEDQVKKVTREIRLALLEADVNYGVVKKFVANVRERATGAEVSRALSPGQQVVKIVNEELASLMGGTASKLQFASRPPTVVMLAGLNGHGKTTTAGKLALFVRKNSGKNPFLVACDTYRPAAIDQLEQIGKEIGVPVYAEGTEPAPEDIAQRGIREARDGGYDFVIVDTAGRQVVDEPMMDEIKRVQSAVRPHSVLLVLDSATGQNAVDVAEAFREYADFDGMVLTKLDGDARGGAALSVVSVTERPIKFASEGEKMGEFDYFYPDRMAGRILGMGDVMTLIEKAEGQLDRQEAEAQSKKLMAGKFDFEDFLKQMQMIKKMGPLSSLLGMIPGLGKQLSGVNMDDLDNKALGRVEAMITSMTSQERRNPKLLQNPSRARRIARGSGTTPQDVQKLVKQFGQMQKMMRQMGGGGRASKRMPRMPFNMR